MANTIHLSLQDVDYYVLPLYRILAINNAQRQRSGSGPTNAIISAHKTHIPSHFAVIKIYSYRKLLRMSSWQWPMPQLYGAIREGEQGSGSSRVCGEPYRSTI